MPTRPRSRRAAADALRLRLDIERRAGLDALPVAKLPPLPPPAQPRPAAPAGAGTRAGPVAPKVNTRAAAPPPAVPQAAPAVPAAAPARPYAPRPAPPSVRRGLAPAAPPSPPDPAWDALEAEAKACVRCAELVANRKQVVFGVGNRKASLLVIGEAPGFDEDEQGIPFVGRAGKLLTQLLEDAGFRREDVYIANVLKCRPPNNRQPAPAEIVNCSAFLRRQIDLLRPRVILALGNHSARSLLSTQEGITRLRGNWRELNGIRLMPSFHPAYLLRNPAETGKAQEDFKAVRAFLAASSGPAAQAVNTGSAGPTS